MELRFGAMLYSDLANKTSDVGHIKCSRGPQIPLPWFRPTTQTRRLKCNSALH